MMVFVFHNFATHLEAQDFQHQIEAEFKAEQNEVRSRFFKWERNGGCFYISL